MVGVTTHEVLKGHSVGKVGNHCSMVKESSEVKCMAGKSLHGSPKRPMHEAMRVKPRLC